MSRVDLAITAVERAGGENQTRIGMPIAFGILHDQLLEKTNQAGQSWYIVSIAKINVPIVDAKWSQSPVENLDA